MDFSRYENCTWDAELFGTFEEEMLDDLAKRLEGTRFSIAKTVPRDFGLSAVVESDDNLRWIHVVLPDVRETGSLQSVTLRRMSSERDWKGDVLYDSTWEDVVCDIEKYMAPEFDGDI